MSSSPPMRGDAGRLGLVLDRGVALQLGDADQAEERQHQLVERRHRGVGEDRRLLGVEARGDVVEEQVAHVAGDVAGDLAVGDDLVVGDELPDLGAAVLEPEAVADRAEVVADVQRAGRAVAGQHPQRGRIRRHLLLDGVAARLGGAEGVTHAADPFTGPIGPANGFCRVSGGADHRSSHRDPGALGERAPGLPDVVGDTTATQIPTHITLHPADRAGRRRSRRGEPSTSPPPRPRSSRSTSTCAAPAPSARSRPWCS